MKPMIDEKYMDYMKNGFKESWRLNCKYLVLYFDEDKYEGGWKEENRFDTLKEAREYSKKAAKNQNWQTPSYIVVKKMA